MNRYLQGVIAGFKDKGIAYEVVKPHGQGLKAKYIQYPLMAWRRRKCEGHSLVISERYAYLTHFMAPNSIVVCHDLHTLYSEAKTPLIHRLIYKLFLSSMNKAHQVVCISDHTRKDLLKMMPRFENHLNVRVVTNGIEHFWADSTTITKDEVSDYTWASLFSEKKVLLSVGTDAWYKNNQWSLRLLAKLGEQFHLLRIGTFHDVNLQLIEDLRISDQVTSTSFINDTALKFCYQNAEALLFPSLSEGYGWPALEAALNGCVVVSDCPGGTHEIFREKKGVVSLKNAEKELMRKEVPEYDLEFQLWNQQVQQLLA